MFVTRALSSVVSRVSYRLQWYIQTHVSSKHFKNVLLSNKSKTATLVGPDKITYLRFISICTNAHGMTTRRRNLSACTRDGKVRPFTLHILTVSIVQTPTISSTAKDGTFFRNRNLDEETPLEGNTLLILRIFDLIIIVFRENHNSWLLFYLK